MDQLPSSIATYLEEAGFSGTEILILRKLMDGEPLTIRQLGAKTGKSTGVLDQAMKKLIAKNIIRKTLINDVPKYALDSLEAVVDWMQEDMEQKREMLLRRHQNFESFVTSLESGSKRPDIEYFEGESGIKQAYIKLLNGPGEILHYLPVMYKEEEDPLRDFRVQYFRERQIRKMFSRVLAHDTVLGHRYQSRDAFEYRKTVLVPEKEYPFTFEKIITGDRIACFDHKAKTACVIRYPELADVERTLFEAIWRQVQMKPTDTPMTIAAQQEPEKIAFSTETMSKIRKFFLTKTSFVTFTFLAVLAFATTYVLSLNNAEVVKLRIKERVKSIAATAALQFDAKDIEQIHDIRDIKKPEYAKLIHHLNRIRRENQGVMFAYIMRPTEEKAMWQFVADADALDPYVIKDINSDGKITDADHLSPPGEYYQETSKSDVDNFKLYEPASYNPATDKWGTHITGSAPILNARGEPIAIVGIDIETSYWHDVSSTTFWPIVSFLGFFLLFSLIRLAAYNRVLFREIFEMLAINKILSIFLVGALCVVFVTLWLYQVSIEKKTQDARAKISALVAAESMDFASETILNLNSVDDVETPEYEFVVRKLHDLREAKTSIKHAYLIRPVMNSAMFSFIADADAFGVDSLIQGDLKNPAAVDGFKMIGYPGSPFDVSYLDVLSDRLYHTPIASRSPSIDRHGIWISGYAPIRDDKGSVIGLLAIDVDAIDIYMPPLRVFFPLVVYFIFCTAYVLFIHGFGESPIHGLMKIFVKKKSLYALMLVAMVLYWILFAFYFLRRNLAQEETGKRLMAIAAMTSAQINQNDLENLHFAREMKTPEYQKVFKKLNEVREANPEIFV